MTKADDAISAAAPASTALPSSADALPCALSEPSDDRAVRRAALRDLAALIGVEVFY